MKAVPSLAAAVALSLCSYTFAQQSTPGNTQTPARDQTSQREGQQGQQQQRSSQMSQQDDRKFVEAASCGNNLEIQLSQFVEQHSQDPQVKQLAQKLIQDHQQAQQQLKQVAQAIGAQVEDQLKPAAQAKLQEMQKKQGAELDRAFIFCNVGDHHKDIMEYQWEARNAQNPQLKQYCEQTLSHLREHLQQVDQVAMGVTGINEAQTASERLPGAGLHDHNTTGTPGNSTNGGNNSGTGTGGTSGTGRTSGTGGTSGGTSGTTGDRSTGGGGTSGTGR